MSMKKLRLGPNGTYKDNRTLGREYGGQKEVETYLQQCKVPPRNDIPSEGLTDAELQRLWDRTYEVTEARCGRRRR